MDWQEALRTRALAVSELAALVGTRIDWLERPQGKTLPAVTFQTIADTRNQHLKGFEDLQPAVVQIDVWAKTYAESRQVTEAIISGLVPGYTGNGHNFARAMVSLPPRDLAERLADKTIFRVSMDLIFNHAINEEGS